MSIDREKNVQVWAVLSKEVYAQLQQIAADQERSVSKQAAYIIKEYISSHSKKK
jgi:hypothetical protein